VCVCAHTQHTHTTSISHDNDTTTLNALTTQYPSSLFLLILL
jgi:hypothetical protein